MKGYCALGDVGLRPLSSPCRPALHPHSARPSQPQHPSPSATCAEAACMWIPRDLEHMVPPSRTRRVARPSAHRQPMIPTGGGSQLVRSCPQTPPSPHTLSVPLTHVCGCSALTGAIAATPSPQFSSPPWTTPEALSTPHPPSTPSTPSRRRRRRRRRHCHGRRCVVTISIRPPTITAFAALIAAFAAFAADDADVDADAPSPSLLPISPPCRRRPPARLAVAPAATRPSCGLCACARVARCAPRTPCVQSSVRPTVRLPVGIHTVPGASRTRVSPMCLVSCVQYVCGLLARGRCVRV